MLKIKKQIYRILLKCFQKFYDPEEKLFKDFVLDEITKMGWHGFIPATYTHVKDWREYYYKNLNNIEDLCENLYKNLDNESIEQAKLLFNRTIKYLPLKNNQSFLKMNLNELFTKQELEEQKKVSKISKSYHLPNNHKVDNYIIYYQHGFSFISNIASDYVKNKDFIDGGAYIGDSALVLNELSPHKIYSFEPEEINFKLINKTIELNSLQNVIVPIQKGLSLKDCILSFEGDKVSGKISENNQNFSISVTSIDNFVYSNNLNPGLIKLDVEGVEYDSIIGAEKTIKEFKPVLLISVYHTLKDFLEIKPLIEKMTDYKFLIRGTRPEMLNTEFMLIGYPAELENAE